MKVKGQPKREKKLDNDIFNALIKSLYIEGEINLNDFADIEFFKKKLKSINENADYKIVLDHSEDLIQTARFFRDKREFQKAKLFYSTHFEHELNGLIVKVCSRMKINSKSTNDIIRSVNFIGKLTWLPAILRLPLIGETHKKIILKLADDRNAYVHYKHNPDPEELQDNKINAEFIQIEKSITYFKKYVARILFNGEKGKLENQLNRKRSK